MKTRIFSLITATLLLGGCSFTPELQVPQPELPQSQGDSTLLQEGWWKQFQSDSLSQAVQTALQNNSDLKQAAIRIERTRAAFRLSQVNLMPSLTGSSDASRTQTSETYDGSSGIILDNLAIGGAISYELDLFGKLKNTKRQMWETLLSQRYNQETIRQAVIAQVVEGYFTIVSLKRQEQIALETLQSRQETFEYRQKQFNQGATTELVLRQAESEVESTRIELYNIENSLTQAKSAFTLLLGQSPREIFESKDRMIAKDNPKVIVNIPEGLPSDMLERRADVQKALADVRASNFAIGVAKSAYYPSISLTGNLGLQSSELTDLFDSSSGVWGLSGSLLTPIFDFGRIDAQVESATESQKLALEIYVQTIRTAFKETRDALSSYHLFRQRLEAQIRQVKALERTLSLAERRFEEGYSSYLEVLDAQRNLFGAQIALENSYLAVAQATIALYKTLGGGWKNS